MQVKYQLTLDDQVALKVWLLKQDSKFKVFRVIYIVLASLVGIVALLELVSEAWTEGVLGLLLTTLLVLRCLTPYYRWRYKRALNQLIQSGRAPGIYDIRTLTMYDTYFTIEGGGQNTSVLYSVIIEVARDYAHLFYRMHNGTASVIPLRIFATEEDRNWFLQTMANRAPAPR